MKSEHFGAASIRCLEEDNNESPVGADAAYIVKGVGEEEGADNEFTGVSARYALDVGGGGGGGREVLGFIKAPFWSSLEEQHVPDVA